MLVQAGQGFQSLFGTQNSIVLEVKCCKRRPKHFDPVHNLPSLIEETSDQRWELKNVPDAPLVRHDCSQMTDGPVVQVTSHDRAAVSSALMVAHQVGLSRV